MPVEDRSTTGSCIVAHGFARATVSDLDIPAPISSESLPCPVNSLLPRYSIDPVKNAHVSVDDNRWVTKKLISPQQEQGGSNLVMDQRNGVHFIGIGGVGMSGLARILLEGGTPVSGSDLGENSQTRMLAALGARIFFGHNSCNIPENTLRVVVSSAISQDNEELLEARHQNLPVVHRSDLLAELFLDSRLGIAVAGCHGKTTVTSMIASVLVDAGQDPTCVVGGNVRILNGNARTGHSGVFVAEADESDATFLKYFPHSAIITNIDNDHMDHYESLDSIVKAFEIFASHLDPSGTLYLCQDDPIGRNIALPENRRVVTYGIDKTADVMAVAVELQPFGATFNVTIGGIHRGSFELSVPGRHNILNALPVIAFCLDLGLTIKQIRDGLKKFHGAGRRFEVKGAFDGVTVIDDYGHHPNEIKATLAAAKSLGARRIVVVFQPHRFSRTQLLSREFGRCFDDCDKLFITDIYSASEKPIEGVTSRLILDHMPVAQRRKTKMVKAPGDALIHLMSMVESGDVVFTIGAGSVTNMGPDLIEAMRARASQAINPAV
ncbi:MAG: UDP-N-acetylmuramate--L-alanine ligase [Candidatus Riflebacteria bacterium]|nr:UDP-N-acetylmuramate--L-alanine ligase [Candidatus Riflebacteria bacterium]